MRYLGIDPGKSGGLALIDHHGRALRVAKMPETDADLRTLLLTWRSDRCTAVIERVRATPQMGVVSAFTFGMGYGRLTMALTCLEIWFHEVSPQRWQTEMGCVVSGRVSLSDRQREKKNANKALAQELFPGVNVTHASADALLLAAYGRRVLS